MIVRCSSSMEALRSASSRLSGASVHPEALDNLLGALRGASIDKENRTIMNAVIKKVQSAKSGLTEACASLLTSFEVSI